MTETLALIDYGAGNIRSAQKSLEVAANNSASPCKIIITNDPDAIRAADRLVLPGVGAYGACANGIRAIDGLWDAIDDSVTAAAKPFLGICVGMQLMAQEGHEHGTHAGFGWIDGSVGAIKTNDPSLKTPHMASLKIPHMAPLKIPHMGWNSLELHSDHPVFKDIKTGDDVYYVHSYAMTVQTQSQKLASSDYGTNITAVVGKDTMIGTQFHPEKSQKVGLQFLSNFLEWRP